MATVTTVKETNAITKTEMAKVREIDFVRQFSHNGLKSLLTALGVTRKVKMPAGATLYAYTTSGTLQSGAVAEGEIIPLSQYATTKTAIGSMTLNKWRKGVTAEAIQKSGYDAAVNETDAALLRDAQKGIRTSLFALLNGTISGSVTATGVGLQAALADGWGKAQIAFEDDEAEMVYFVNPTDVAKYLAAGQITVQTAFGLSYVENFLGLGTVILSSRITAGTYVATAKNNIVCYYMDISDDVGSAFNLTSDELGLVGIKSGYQNEERAQIESLVMSGVTFGVEYAAGVIKGTVTAAAAS